MTAQQRRVRARRLTQARRVLREASADKDHYWLGLAPSYLCAALPISYDEAIALLLTLEAEGFIVDSGHGGQLARPDGRIGTNRFYLA